MYIDISENIYLYKTMKGVVTCEWICACSYVGSENTKFVFFIFDGWM